MSSIELEVSVGSQDRERDDDERRAKDRTACVVFGMPTERRDGWSGAQWWAYKNRLFIGEHIDGLTYADDAPCARPGLIRLVTSARRGLPGGVLIEQPTYLVDRVALAVVAECLAKISCELRLGKYRGRSGPVVSTPSSRAYWTQLAGGSGTVGELVQALDDAVDLRLTEETSEFVKGWGDSSRLEGPELLEVGRGIVEFMGLGHGPHRDTVLAHSAASQRRKAGWSDVRIRRYLELYGFTNHAGRVGVWGHEQFKALELGSSNG
jgi:hypothetical protein